MIPNNTQSPYLAYINNNQKMSGGCNTKQGLPPTIGYGQFSINAIKKTAGYCACVSAKYQPNRNKVLPSVNLPPSTN